MASTAISRAESALGFTAKRRSLYHVASTYDKETQVGSIWPNPSEAQRKIIGGAIQSICIAKIKYLSQGLLRQGHARVGLLRREVWCQTDLVAA